MVEKEALTSTRLEGTSLREEAERYGALESKTPERWRVALAVLVALIALPVLLLDYQSGANADDDSVTLSLDESGELVTDDPDGEDPAATTTSSTIVADATQATDVPTTVPDTAVPTTVAPTTAAPSSTATPTTTEPQAPTSTAPPATDPPSTQPPETTPPATVPDGTQPPETVPPQTVPSETVPPGTTPPDTTPPETVPPETTPPETVPPDTTPPETTVPAVGAVTPVPAEPGDPTPDQWWTLRQCESTNNYSAISASGKFRGAYQFSQATWNWVADNFHPELSGVDPAAAIPANQDAMALALTRMQSPGNAWPKCSRTAGIA